MRYVGTENEFTVFKRPTPGVPKKDFFDFFHLVRRPLEECGMLGDEIVNPKTQQYGVSMGQSLWLANGGRIYRDGSTLEYASPECRTIEELVLVEKAGDLIVETACRDLGAVDDIFLMKRTATRGTTQGKVGGSPTVTWGSHESYAILANLYQRLTKETCAMPEGVILRWHFAGRQTICGAGHLGYLYGYGNKPTFWVSPRTQFIYSEVNSSTKTLGRSIINSRDEPHMEGNLSDMKRLHIIIGDMNRSDWSVYLRFGTTVLVLAYLAFSPRESREKLLEFFPARKDLVGQAKLASICFSDERYQQLFTELLDSQRRIRDAISNSEEVIKERVPEFDTIMENWSGALDAVSSLDPEHPFAKRLDWLIKKNLFENISGYDIGNTGEAGADITNELFSLDFSYHRLNHSDLYRRLLSDGLAEEMFEKSAAEKYCFSPPKGRAAVRAVEAIRYIRDLGLGEHVYLVNLSKIVFIRRKGLDFPTTDGKGRSKDLRDLIIDDRNFEEIKLEIDNIYEWTRR